MKLSSEHFIATRRNGPVGVPAQVCGCGACAPCPADPSLRRRGGSAVLRPPPSPPPHPPLFSSTLFSLPDAADAPPAPRACAPYVSRDTPFLLPAKRKSFGQQYAPLYFSRLKIMEPRVLEAARAAWPDLQGA